MNIRNPVGFALLSFGIIFSLLFGGCEKKPDRQTQKPGEPKEIRLMEAGGKADNLLAYLRDPVTIVINAATWDPVSMAQIKEAQNVVKKLENRKINVVVFVFEDEEWPVVQEFKAKNNLQIPVFVGKGKTKELFGSEEIVPTTFLVSKDMKILKKINGYVDGRTLELKLWEVIDRVDKKAKK